MSAGECFIVAALFWIAANIAQADAHAHSHLLSDRPTCIVAGFLSLTFLCFGAFLYAIRFMK